MPQMISLFISKEFANATKKWHGDGHETFPWDDVAADFKRLNCGHDYQRLSLQLHHANFCVWHHEDRARSGDEAAVVTAKRGIDRYNQIRNDLIELIDDSIIYCQRVSDSDDDRKVLYNTETPGSIIDRISILDLKCWHTTELIVDAEIHQSSKEKYGKLHRLQNRLLILKDQHAFLVAQLQLLVDDMWAGRRLVKIFRQLKMYNDPELNKQHRDNK